MTCCRIFASVLLLLATQLPAQTGNFFVTNLPPPDEKIDPRSVGITQDELGVIYFTNRNGILEFDGNSWRLIPTPGSVYTLTSSGNEIFAGGSFGFGKLGPTNGKAHEFQLISTRPNVFSSIKVDDKIFFCNENEVFSYSILLHQIDKTTLVTGDENLFTGLYSIGEKLYATTIQSGLQRIVNGAMVMPDFALPDGQTLVFSAAHAGGKESILGTEEGKLFRFQTPDIINPIPLTDNEYLEHHILVNGSLVNEDLLAIGTLKGGIIFVNIKTGATQEIIDYYMGLPDNEVTALFTDKNKGVWATHEYGFSRIAPFLPFRSFNHYPGLSGNLICVKEIDGKLFVGTSLGLYYLKTEEQYETIQIIQSPVKTNITPVPQKEKTRKKLFGFLKSKKNTEEKTVTTKATDKPKIQPVIKTTKKILKSRQYVFQKVEGIDGKVTQLLEVNGKIIVAGLGGAYWLNELKGELIVEEPVRYVFHSTALNQLLISTYDDRTVSLAPINNNWRETHYVDSLHDYISYIFEDDEQNIWFCGKSQVYKMELADDAVTAFQALPIQNPLFDETVGLALGPEVFIAASGKFFRYDKGKGFVNDSKPGPKKYFASAEDFWFNDGHRWSAQGKKNQNFKLEWLGLFPNLRYISPTSDGTGLWLVTANNELYKFTNPINEQAETFHPLFLRDVKGDQIKLLEGKNLRIDQSENVVSFEFTQPNYTGFRATEFRYRVEGLNKDWSVWSNVNNVITFSYLPPGEYQLAVQSRDILGKESNVELVAFEVLPYYWKRWWFYALEFTFFTILVVISIKLSRSNERYQVISQVLSLLTVILLIQFIETGIDSFIEFKSSPVVEFLIQLGITLVVFPVESQLQRFMRYAAGVTKTKNDDLPWMG